MKKFRLEKILQLKQFQLQQQQMAMAKLQEKHEEKKGQILQMKKTKEKYWKVKYLRNPNYQGYFENLSKAIETLEMELFQLEYQIQEERQKLKNFHQEVKQYERLKDKFQTECSVQAKRKEQKEMDEIASRRTFYSI